VTRAGVKAFAPSVAVLVLLAAQLVALPARAALFDDDEARKRIDAVKVRVDALEQSLSQRLDAIEARSGALVDLFKDVEQIKADIAKLRGQYEVLTYELEQSQKRQRDLYVDLDSRLRKLEGGPGAGAPTTSGAPTPGDAASTPPVSGTFGPPPTVTPTLKPNDVMSEQRAYDGALEQFKTGSYASAVTSFQSFVRTFPKSPLAPSALYWAGNAQYAQKDFRGAITTQRQLLSTFPDSQKVPDALLNIASCQIELGDAAGTKRSLEEIVAKYPTSEAAGKARQRLAGR
jgi:tol-pal system protein YbgF